MRIPALASVLALALVSCSSGVSSMPPASQFSQPNAAFAAKGGTAVVVVRIDAPGKAREARVRLIRDGRPAYISASTKALKIVAVNGSKRTPTVVSLTPKSPGCTTTAGITSCTAKIFLPVCTKPDKCYTALVSTYDKVFCNGAPPVCSIPAGANELSAGQSVPFRVAKGGSNTVSLTLSGVPHSMTVSADTLTPGSGSYFDLVGPGAHALTGQTYDADGNAIVGPGSPTFKASSPTGGLPVTVTAPSSAPYQLWVAPPTTLDTSQTASFQMTPTFSGQTVDGCKQPGANCKGLQVTVDMVPMVVFLENTIDLNNAGKLDFYALDQPDALLSITGRNSTGYGLQSDAAGDIFTPNGVPTIYSPPLSTAAAQRPKCCPSGSVTMAAGASADGSARFLTYYPAGGGNQNVVSTCTPAACSATAYVLPYSTSQVFASNAEGDFVYGNPGVTGVTNCYAYAYPASNYRAPVMLAGPPMNTADCAAFVAIDASGNAFVNDLDNHQIVEYSKSTGYQTATRIQLGSNMAAVTMLADSSGDLFDIGTQYSSYPCPPPTGEQCEYGQGIVQETYASTLSSNQGGTVSPDQTSVTNTGPGPAFIAGAVATFGPNGLYIAYSQGSNTGPVSLVEIPLPSLFPPQQLSLNTPPTATGLLVLP